MSISIYFQIWFLRNLKKVQPFRPWFDQFWPRFKTARNPLKVCMHGYLSNGYLNSLWNFNYNKVEKIASLRPLLDQPWITTKISTSKVNLHHTVLLRFGLKELKITLNIMKVGVHTSHPNAHQKIWSNLIPINL